MGSPQTYDYIIVGGGSAGCLIAARLVSAEAGTIALIERGDRSEANPETLSADGFKYAFANDKVMLDRLSIPQPECNDRTLYAGTGSVIGGSGAVNGMVYTRGDKLDFEQWPPGWKWQDNEPAFQAVEAGLRIRHREGTTFTEKALQAAEAVGFKRKHGMNDGALCGFMGYNDMNYEHQERRNSYTAFLRDQANDSANQRALTIHTHSIAYKILFEGDRAVGVEVEIKGKKQIVKANKEVILCAGALETPKLLMLSGVGPADHLKSLGIPVVKDIPSIGNNLHDHPNVAMFYRGRQPVDFGYPQIYGFQRFNPQLPLPEDQADTCMAWMAAPVTMQQSMRRMGPATMLKGKKFFNPVLRFLVRTAVIIATSLPPVNKMINSLYGIVVILGKPQSRGTLRLASTNVKEPALIDLAYFRDPADMDTMLNAIACARDIAAHQGLKEWGNKPLAGQLNSSKPEAWKKWVLNNAMTTFHFCGTCSMGEQNDTPVDTRLKLKGIKNLRIADASVIPVIPVSALNAPTMMVAYRAADFILQDQAG